MKQHNDPPLSPRSLSRSQVAEEIRHRHLLPLKVFTQVRVVAPKRERQALDAGIDLLGVAF